MSKIIVIGNIVRDNEIGQCSNGAEYLRTSMAENFSEESSVFYSLTLFNPSEYAKKNFQKGARFQIIGDFEDYAYNNDGEIKMARNIKVESYQLLARKKNVSPQGDKEKIR